MPGTELSKDCQHRAKMAFQMRFTKDHVPFWAKREFPYFDDPVESLIGWPPQFASDHDWLMNTEFAVTGSARFDARVKVCVENPTWPDNEDLRSMPEGMWCRYAPNRRQFYPSWEMESDLWVRTNSYIEPTNQI